MEDSKEVMKESVVIAVFKKVPRLLSYNQLTKNKIDEIVYNQGQLKYIVNTSNKPSFNGFQFTSVFVFYLMIKL